MKIPLPATYTFEQAMARIEGWYLDDPTHPNGDRPQRNNNPGDLEYTVFTIGAGATGTDGRFAVFPDADTGWFALRELLRGPEYNYLTVTKAINRFAPPCENNTTNYVTFVCKLAKCGPDEILGDVLKRQDASADNTNT